MNKVWGTWEPQSVKPLPSAWVVIPECWDGVQHGSLHSGKLAPSSPTQSAYDLFLSVQ